MRVHLASSLQQQVFHYFLPSSFFCMFLGQHFLFVHCSTVSFSYWFLAFSLDSYQPRVCVCLNNLPFIIIFTKSQLVLFIQDHSTIDKSLGYYINTPRNQSLPMTLICYLTPISIVPISFYLIILLISSSGQNNPVILLWYLLVAKYSTSHLQSCSFKSNLMKSAIRSNAKQRFSLSICINLKPFL